MGCLGCLERRRLGALPLPGLRHYEPPRGGRSRWRENDVETRLFILVASASTACALAHVAISRGCGGDCVVISRELGAALSRKPALCGRLRTTHMSLVRLLLLIQVAAAACFGGAALAQPRAAVRASSAISAS